MTDSYADFPDLRFERPAPGVLGVVLLGATVWWFATARGTYTGPVSYGTPEELAAMEAEAA